MIGLRPAPDMPAPALRMGGPGLLVDVPAMGEDLAAGAGVTLHRRDESDLAVPVLAVVPGHESHAPVARRGDVREAPAGEARHVLHGAER